MEPKVLLFDEVTSALDPTLVGEVLVVMEDLAHEGATMIVVTHEMAFAREAADRVYFIDEGRFVEVGPPEQVIDDPRDPRTIEFLARTHGTGAHVHGGVTVAPAPVAESRRPSRRRSLDRRPRRPRPVPGVDMPHGH